MRNGSLSLNRLRFASLLEDPASRLALGVSPATPTQIAAWGSNAALKAWATSVVDLGGRAGAVRLLVALCHGWAASLPRVLGLNDLDEATTKRRDLLLDMVAQVEEWIVVPTPRAKREVVRSRSARRPLPRELCGTPAGRALTGLGDLVLRCTIALSAGVDTELRSSVVLALGALWREEERQHMDGLTASSLQAEVVPWALGESDPVTERVLSRQGR